MSYIGNQPPDIGAYDVESFDGGGTSFTLKRAATVSSVLLFIDGVRQTPTDAYTVSGTALTTTATTPSGTDNVTVMFMGDVVDIGAPSADTVSTAKIQDDAVTAAKLANSINTEIAANTAKVTNATHTGDVTGATALTIATDAVDIAMLSATGTADATTFLRGDNAWAAAAGGKIGQVLVVEDATAQTLATATYTATGLSQVITPSASSSKILCVWTMMGLLAGGGSGQGFSVQVNRSISGGAATDIYTSSGSYDVYTDQSGCHGKGVWVHLDSPSTTSATTYLVKVSSMSGYSITLNTNDNQTQLLLMEVLA